MQTIEQQATNTINKLKEVYTGDNTSFDFFVSQWVSGDSNKPLRQEIIKQITGEKKPVSKCGMYAVADVLKYSFQQYNLFIQ